MLFRSEPCVKSDGENDYTARRNAKQVMQWISTTEANIRQVSVSFGQGNPAIYDSNLDCYGIACSADGTYEVSNQRYYLTCEDRDPSMGEQSLFCMFGGPEEIWPADRAFGKEYVAVMVQKARERGLEKAATMKDRDLLKTYSSTPQFEVPWFCESVRMVGNYVRMNSKNKNE